MGNSLRNPISWWMCYTSQGPAMAFICRKAQPMIFSIRWEMVWIVWILPQSRIARRRKPLMYQSRQYLFNNISPCGTTSTDCHYPKTAHCSHLTCGGVTFFNTRAVIIKSYPLISFYTTEMNNCCHSSTSPIFRGGSLSMARGVDKGRNIRYCWITLGQAARRWKRCWKR